MDQSARGKKRRCLQCAEAFYDLNRDPAPCPYCGHSHPLAAFVQGKRPPAPAPAPKPAAVAAEDSGDEATALEGDDDDDDVVLDDDEDDLDDDDDGIVKVGVEEDADD